MNLGKVRVAYPYVEYRINVTHHTERKSTAPEWLLLEIARTAEEYPEYNAIPLDNILRNLFFVVDGDALLRQVLKDLIDVQALRYIPSFSDASDWNQLRCGDLKLTDVGRNLQRQGRLPAKAQENSLTVTYDVTSNRLLADGRKNLLDDTDSPKVRDITPDNLPAFPESLILERIETSRGKANAPNWLQANSQIESIEPVESRVKWQNTIKSIVADEDGNISLQDETDAQIIERVLQTADFGELPASGLPTMSLNDLSTRRKVQPYAKVVESILAAASGSEILFIASQFEEVLSRLDKKTCLIGGQCSFTVEQSGTNTLIRLPMTFEAGLCYQDSQGLIVAGAVEFRFGNTTRTVAYTYETDGDFEQRLLRVAEDYYQSEPRVLKLLSFVTKPTYKKFYTEEFFKRKLNAPQWEIITPVDEAVEQLLKLDKKAANFLSAPASCAEIRRAFLGKGADFLRDVHDWASQWHRALATLREQVDFDLTEHFMASMNRAEKITEAISLFFDEASEGYSKIYVIETSALRHYPALLDDFADNRAMIVVPMEVQTALKELTESEEGKDKSNAEKAILKVAEYKSYRWLNLDEESDAELLAETERDFKAFAVALKYLAKNPVLVTDDAALRGLAAARNIETITAHELHEKLNGDSVSKGKAKNKTKRKKK